MLQLLSGIQIEGETAKKYCGLSKENKIQFIIKHCKVEETAAKAFVEKPLVHMDGKQCCGGHRTKETFFASVGDKLTPNEADTIVRTVEKAANKLGKKK